MERGLAQNTGGNTNGIADNATIMIFPHHAHVLFGQFPPLLQSSTVAILPDRHACNLSLLGHSNSKAQSPLRDPELHLPPVFFILKLHYGTRNLSHLPLYDLEAQNRLNVLEFKSNLDFFHIKLFKTFFLLDCYDILEASV